jgi:hypothetical protein
LNKTRNRWIGRILYAGFLVSVVVILLDVTVTFLLGHGNILLAYYEHPYFNPFREYYARIDRKIIQYLPECARYDGELSYTLKPGTCRFQNREFDVEYRINSAGLRDDESSLASPDIIVLGDSHALGWGVEQDQTYADLIEQKIGMKVLNAAMSSYGTVRELKMLGRLDTRNLKYVILQYTNNDILENREYLENGNDLPIMSRHEYDETVAAHAKASRHFLGKHSLWTLSSLLGSLVSAFESSASASQAQPDPNAEEVKLFLNVLAHSPVDLDDVKVVVVEINSYAGNSPDFINSLAEAVKATSSPAWRENLILMDLSRDLTLDKYFSLDEHMTADGYRAVADKLVGTLNAERR